MGIFINIMSPEQLNAMCKNTMVEHLEIEFIEVGDDHISARMPVSHKTMQPYRLLHGGASVVLAETLGSIASSLCIDNNKYICVGLEINANHIKSVREGYVIGKSTPIHIGKKTHIWNICITTEKDELVCINRLTVMVLDKGNK